MAERLRYVAGIISGPGDSLKADFDTFQAAQMWLGHELSWLSSDGPEDEAALYKWAWNEVLSWGEPHTETLVVDVKGERYWIRRVLEVT